MTGQARDRAVEMRLPVAEVRSKSNDSNDLDYSITRLPDCAELALTHRVGRTPPTRDPTASGRRPSRSRLPAAACSKKRFCSSISPRITRSMPRCRALVIASTRGRQRSTNACASRACASARLRQASRPLLGRGVGSGPARFGSTAERRDGGRQPGQVRVLAVDDVLVSVVRVVLRDGSRAGLVPRQDGQLLAVALLQELQQIVHEPCFSLQVMQTRDQGIAFSRASAIGSPQSRQTP